MSRHECYGPMVCGRCGLPRELCVCEEIWMAQVDKSMKTPKKFKYYLVGVKGDKPSWYTEDDGTAKEIKDELDMVMEHKDVKRIILVVEK